MIETTVLKGIPQYVRLSYHKEVFKHNEETLVLVIHLKYFQLLNSNTFSQISRLIDIKPFFTGNVVSDEL